MRIIFLVVFVMLSASCSGLDQVCKPRQDICGFIDEEFFEGFVKLSQEKSSITLSSYGGYQDYAIKVANYANEQNVAVVIDGICLSSCAQNLVLGVKNVKLNSDALVGFHQSSSSMLSLAKTHLPEEKEYISFLDKYARLEEAFFDQNSLDENALLVPAYAQEYTCLLPNIVYVEQDYKIYIESKYDWVFPTSLVINKWRGGHSDVGGVFYDERSLDKAINSSDNFRGSNRYLILDLSLAQSLQSNFDLVDYCEGI